MFKCITLLLKVRSSSIKLIYTELKMGCISCILSVQLNLSKSLQGMVVVDDLIRGTNNLQGRLCKKMSQFLSSILLHIL